MKCYPYDGIRYIHDQHQAACTGAGPDWHPPLAWIDCAGCTPCPAQHCAVCIRTHLENDQQTCPACLTDTRNDLGQIMQLTATAEQRLNDWWPTATPGTGPATRNSEPPLPGGDLLVLVAGGSPGDTHPGTNPDERPTDATSPVGELAGWEDWWRRLQHQAPNTASPVLSRVIGYLTLHLTWAAQHDPHFPGFHATTHRLRGRLEQELRDAGSAIRGVACFDCGTTLTRPLRDPEPCRHTHEAHRAQLPVRTWLRTLASYPELGDEHASCNQGGYDDQWACPRCRRIYTEREYWFAVRAAIDSGREVS